ncbi:MAG: hypothetical protein JRI56_00145 [Deltaproteobacteria bacterium]|nr:hypothetical protein [Deltaproteobacteria bacterium]
MKVRISTKPKGRYLKLHNGDIYDRQSDTIIIKEAVLETVLGGDSNDQTRVNRPSAC